MSVMFSSKQLTRYWAEFLLRYREHSLQPNYEGTVVTEERKPRHFTENAVLGANRHISILAAHFRRTKRSLITTTFVSEDENCLTIE
jgi:hypothetical protein